MKISNRLTLFFLFCVFSKLQAQNTFPVTGNVGIGTSTPRGILHVVNERNYFVNRTIPGGTEDSQGINYLLLHKIYNGAILGDHHVMGVITAIRGSEGAWNRKLTIEVNTSSAYNSDRGSIICYNEPARLVTVTYQGDRYLAVEIANQSTLFPISFTGYAVNEAFQLVYDQHVSDVQVFQSLDPLTIQGGLALGTMDLQGYKLAVNGNIRAKEIKVEAGNWPDYVFTSAHDKPTIPQLESFIANNKHLPGIPSAQNVQKEGINIGEMNSKLLEKIEELTLYIIELKKEIDHQQEQINELRKGK